MCHLGNGRWSKLHPIIWGPLNYTVRMYLYRYMGILYRIYRYMDPPGIPSDQSYSWRTQKDRNCDRPHQKLQHFSFVYGFLPTPLATTTPIRKTKAGTYSAGRVWYRGLHIDHVASLKVCMWGNRMFHRVECDPLMRVQTKAARLSFAHTVIPAACGISILQPRQIVGSIQR